MKHKSAMKYLRKLHRAATSLILLLLYIAPIARKNPTQKNNPSQLHPVIMSETPAPNSKSQSIEQAESIISTSEMSS